MLSDYIDFNKFTSDLNENECGGYNESYFTKRSPDYIWIDDAKVDENMKQSALLLILNAKNYYYFDYDENIQIVNNEVRMIKKLYRSADKRYIVFYMVLYMHYENEDEDEDEEEVVHDDYIDYDDGVTMFGVVDTVTDQYVFLGSSHAHPFISTNNYVYGNSDGSGPNIHGDMNNVFTTDNIFCYMLKYYKEFTDDHYH